MRLTHMMLPRNKVAIIVHSYHHNNTLKVASAMAEVLNCRVFTLDENLKTFNAYALVGFGAGIDSGHHYNQLLDYVRKLEPVHHKDAFIFSTSGIQGEEKVKNDHKELRTLLIKKGFSIIGEYSCKGFNTNSFMKFFGGINKGHPTAKELQAAQNFAINLIKREIQ